MYYSPNCSRSVPLPEFNQAVAKEQSLFMLKDPRVAYYHYPLWWTRQYGWISCLPMDPFYNGPIFKRLAFVPTQLNMHTKDGVETGYALPETLQQSWLRLESSLAFATSLMAKEYSIPTTRPFSPWALGYTHGRRSHRYTVAQAFRSRDWFTVWIGLMSYLIA
jgi:hypothetical protein